MAAAIMAPLMVEAGLDDAHSRALTVVAIGAGATIVCHVNDSYFWVYSRLLGCSLKLGVQLLTSGSLVLGVSSVCDRPDPNP